MLFDNWLSFCGLYLSVYLSLSHTAGPLEFTGIGSSSAFLKPSLALLASAMLALVAAMFL